MKMTKLFSLKVYPLTLHLPNGGSSNNVPQHIVNIQNLKISSKFCLLRSSNAKSISLSGCYFFFW